MLLNLSRLIAFVSLSSILFVLVSAVPNLGVQKDFAAQFPTDSYQSYSAVVIFDDKTIPGDKAKMSDAQFINLAKVAYEEMISIWSRSNLPSELCPGAMIALESEGTLYFASAVRSRNGIDINAIDRNIQNSIGWFQYQCQIEGMGTHRNGGHCAEPNVLRLYGDQNGIETTPENPTGTYKSPPKTNTSPRIAVWGRPSGTQPNQNQEAYFLPCADTPSSGYGCNRMVAFYGLKAVSKKTPDPNSQDDWQFKPAGNHRRACAAPPLALEVDP